MRAWPIGDRFRRNVRWRSRADVRRLLVHDFGNLWRSWGVGFPRVFEHAVMTCNPDPKADLEVGLYGSKSKAELYGFDLKVRAHGLRRAS